MSHQQKWDRRDSKKESKRRLNSDNRKSVRNILNILIKKAQKIKEKNNG